MKLLEMVKEVLEGGRDAGGLQVPCFTSSRKEDTFLSDSPAGFFWVSWGLFLLLSGAEWFEILYLGEL